MKYSRLLLLAIVYLLGQLDIARAAIVPDGDVVPGPETAPWPWGSYTTGYVGQNGHGSLLVNEGGHLYSGDGIIAKANSATGEVTVSGAGSTWENTYGIYVGSFGNGRLAIADGALVTVGSNLAVGEHGNSSSEMIVSGGGDVVIAGSLEGGRYETSQGRITVNGAGSTIETGYMFLGLNGSSVGTLRVESEGLVSVAHDVVLGETATGQAMILSGADATVDGTTKIGLQAGSHGGLTVDGAGSTWTNTYLYVGYAGSGTVAVTNGGTVSNYSCFLGDQPGGAGAVTVNGADSTWTVAGDAWIGHSGGSGTVTVADGGSATALGLHIWRGTLAVGQGGSVSVTSTDAVDVTDEGRIEMDGGTLSTAGVLRLDGDHAALTGHGVVNGALWGNCLLGTGVTASGGKLVVGDATRADGVDFTGPVTVGDNATLELVDADAARAPSVTLDNGVLVARNGIGALFRRNLCGVVVGNGSITMPQLTGTVDMTQAVDVGTSLARVYSVDTPTFGGSVTLDGGRMVSPHGLTISVSGSLSGWGTIETLLGSTAADPGELVVRDGEVILDGGTISAISLLRLNGDYAALTGHGTVNSALWGYCPYGEGLTASGGKLVVGDAARTDGVWFSGPVTVADNATLELADADHAYLAEITLDNGVLIARNGVDLDFAPGGYGVVVGDAQHLPSPTGTVNLTQALDVGASVAEVYSASRPTFGGSVTLDGGRLVSSNGLTISTGGRFSGCGVIEAFGGGGGDYPGYITLRDVDVTLEGGSISAADSALVSGSTLRGYGTIEGRLVDEAAVEVAGGTLTCTRIIVSESGDAHGTVSVIGADAVLSLSADGWSSVGYGGTGTLAIEDGGAVHAHGALSIGTWGGSNGDATVTGTGSMLIGSCEINVGEHGTGRIEVTGGGSVSAAGMSVGNNSGAGTVTVGGNESSLSVANGWLQIGRSGTGTIRVEDGGTLHAADTSYFVVGSSANSDGELVVTGDGSTAAIVCGGTLGAEGTGSLTVADGGSMTIRGLSIGNDLGGHGDATVTGTGSTLAMSDGEGMAIGARGVGLLTIGSGGAVMAANVWIAQWSDGSGTLRLDGGTLDASGGTINVGAGGRIEGSGTLIGNVAVSGGTVEPGNSPGMLKVDGSLSLDDAATLAIDLAGTSPGEFDRLEVADDLTLDGTLDVQFFDDFSPVVGDTFDVLDWSTLAGMFDEVTLPDLGNGLQWDTSSLYISGTLGIVASSFTLGDANRDGLVDDADATILASHWHQTSGANWFDGDFNGDGVVNDVDASILAAHWHEGAESFTPNVPEPTTPSLLDAAAIAFCFFRRRGRWIRRRSLRARAMRRPWTRPIPAINSPVS